MLHAQEFCLPVGAWDEERLALGRVDDPGGAEAAHLILVNSSEAPAVGVCEPCP